MVEEYTVLERTDKEGNAAGTTVLSFDRTHAYLFNHLTTEELMEALEGVALEDYDYGQV